MAAVGLDSQDGVAQADGAVMLASPQPTWNTKSSYIKSKLTYGIGNGQHIKQDFHIKPNFNYYYLKIG